MVRKYRKGKVQKHETRRAEHRGWEAADKGPQRMLSSALCAPLYARFQNTEENETRDSGGKHGHLQHEVGMWPLD